MSAPTDNRPADIEVYPTRNKGTRSGRPLRWRYRIIRTGRVKAFATPEQVLLHVHAHFPGLKVDVSAVPRF